MTEILSATAFDERVATRSARVGIVGLGYAGLPLAMAFAEAGFDVTGIDLSRERVDAIAERPLLPGRRARRALRRRRRQADRHDRLLGGLRRWTR